VIEGHRVVKFIMDTLTADLSTMSGRRVAGSALVDVAVRGDGNGDYAPLLPIADRVDTVLQNALGLKDGVSVVKLVRTATQQFVDDDAGKSYTHVIQTYRTPRYAT
jgi:hypothetical protein